jgi:hypothetical protein
MKQVFLISRRNVPSRPTNSSQPERRSSAYKGIVASIMLAIASAAIGYIVSFVDEHRKAKILKVNTQIEKLYGPLYAYSVASRRAWDDLHTLAGRGTYYFDDGNMPSAGQVELWRRWMKEVLMPINKKMESTIVDNAQLLDGNSIYPLFVDLISHVESYKATIATWKDTDNLTLAKNRIRTANTAVIIYPIGLDDCIEARLQATLKRRTELELSWSGFVSESGQKFADKCS